MKTAIVSPRSVLCSLLALWSFDADPPGVLPKGFTREAGEWRVVADETAPSKGRVLAQEAKNPGSTFNLVLVDGTSYRDLDLEVKLNALAGDEDQGGGLVWRAADAKNYYLARFNPLEGNFRLYKVERGKRTQLASADIKGQGGWHTLRVTMKGELIECFFDGKKHLEAKDSTFPSAGMIGIWSKADARSRFDDLTVQAQEPAAASPRLDTARIEAVTGLSGALNAEEGVFKVTSPRVDVPVAVEGWKLPPFLGLTSWAAFQAGGKSEAMVMGDLVLFEDEVHPVMQALLESGLTVTALHNHFFFDEPRVFFLHVGGEGRAEALAGGVRKALDRVREIRAASPSPRRTLGGAGLPEKSALDAPAVERILGANGQARDGILKVVIGRKVKMQCGCEVGKEMGVNSWAAFFGNRDAAVVDGDFVTFEGELQPVLNALVRAGIHVVAIHNHMEGESPKAIFLHYWGRGKAEDLARGLRAALDEQAAAAKPR